MWVDELKDGQSWWGVWYGLGHCDDCHALMYDVCPVCGARWKIESIKVIIDDVEHVVPSARQGAISWSTNVLLELMRQEWNRPLTVPDAFERMPPNKRPAQRAVLAILFWTLFEHLMDRFYATALNHLPKGVRSDLLGRHKTIGSRLDRLYHVVWGTSFKSDLERLGHADMFEHLVRIQNCRNEFVHGSPEAIDENLIADIVGRLQDVQRAWIDLYNLHCTHKPEPIAVWQERPI